MNPNMQRMCAWSGIFFISLCGIGWWFVAQFIPPHSPTATAAEIADIYLQNTVRIRIGLALALFSAGFSMPFVAVISTHMKRIEGSSPVLAYTQLGCGAIGILIFIIPMMIWLGIDYRPERPAEITLALNDVAWHILLMTLSPAFVQNLSIGIAILSDKRANPVFPRWAGYMNIWVSILFIPAGVLTFFKTGPFAWNGILAFWMPAAIFGIWIFAMFFLLLKATAQEEKEYLAGTLAKA